jgi:hypothetical protein
MLANKRCMLASWSRAAVPCGHGNGSDWLAGLVTFLIGKRAVNVADHAASRGPESRLGALHVGLGLAWAGGGTVGRRA